MILSFAVRGTPALLRHRYSEEWRAHLDEIPGDLAKLLVALGFVWATRKMNDATGEHGAEPVDASADDALTVTSVRSLTLDDLKALARSCPDPWPPICEAAGDGKHEVSGAALYISGRYGVRTFQGPCTLCGEWVDTGEMID